MFNWRTIIILLYGSILRYLGTHHRSKANNYLLLAYFCVLKNLLRCTHLQWCKCFNRIWCCNYSPWNNNQFGLLLMQVHTMQVTFFFLNQNKLVLQHQFDEIVYFPPQILLRLYSNQNDLLSVTSWLSSSIQTDKIERSEKCTRTTLMANSHYNL